MNMDQVQWSQIRDEACDRFGETPGAQLEQDVLEEFERRPGFVVTAIANIADKVAAGKVRSGWAVLRTQLRASTSPDVTVTDEAARTKAIDRAKTWIRNAGLHYDRQDHVLADLFGDDYAKGPLTAYDTPQLRNELADYWHTHRPRGEQAEQDHEAWNAKAKADRHLVLALRSKPTSEDIDFT